MDKVVIFGAGKIAEVVATEIINDYHQGWLSIVAFTVDREYLPKTKLFDRHIVPFRHVQDTCPPDKYEMFVAVGYQELNQLRARKYEEAKAKGYRLISYISPQAQAFGLVGENCLVLENSVIQPGAKIGNNVFVWSGNHIGHHATIGDNCFLSGHVIIGGSTVVGPNCYFGVNATIGHEITIGEGSFIGAGTLITKDVPPHSVYIRKDTQKYPLDSESFLKLTRMK